MREGRRDERLEWHDTEHPVPDPADAPVHSFGPGAPQPGEAPWPDPWGVEAPTGGRRLLDLAAIYGPFLLLFAMLAVPLAWLLWSAEQKQELTDTELALLEANSRGAEAVIDPTTPGGLSAGTPVRTEATGTVRLRISSFPLGATVRVNGDSVGVTPLTLNDLVAGLHAVAVHKEDYMGKDSLLHVAGGTYASLLFMLARADQSATLPQSGVARASSQSEQSPSARPRGAAAPASAAAERSATGAVTITSEPSGAAVWLDDQRIGSTPATLDAVPVGQRLITLRMDGYEPFTREVDVRPETMVTLQGTLVEAIGTVSLLVRPWGSIYIDGALHQQDTDVMYHTTLPAGTHQIRAVHPTLGSMDRMVQIESGDEVALVLDLNEAVRTQLAARAESLAAQTSMLPTKQDEHGFYLITDTPPEPIGGVEELHRRAVYPAMAREMGLEGRVYVRFVVDEQGQVHNAFVVRGVGGGCEGEALRVVSQARFRPATIDGQPVAAWHTLFITFKLDS